MWTIFFAVGVLYTLQNVQENTERYMAMKTRSELFAERNVHKAFPITTICLNSMHSKRKSEILLYLAFYVFFDFNFKFFLERMQKNVDPIFIKHISSYYAESYDNQHLFSDNSTENERLTNLFSTYDMFEVRFLFSFILMILTHIF